jgi:alpha-galactosidase
MPTPRLFTVIVMLLSSLSALAQATPGEMQARDQWVAARFGGGAAALPISFTLDGAPSATLLKTWKLERTERKLDGNRTEITLTCTDPASGLSVRCVAVQYRDYPAIEWTPYFKNTGSAATPIIADIRALDAKFERATPGEFVLDHAKGSPAEPSSYAPRATALGKKERKFELATFGGRSSNSTMPYWKLTWGNEGVVTAVGWLGQWAADFESIGDKSLRVRAGQQTTHFKLEPGEEVRAPLIALVFWQGDKYRAQNLWRQWFVALPKHECDERGTNFLPWLKFEMRRLLPCADAQ